MPPFKISAIYFKLNPSMANRNPNSAYDKAYLRRTFGQQTLHWFLQTRCTWKRLLWNSSFAVLSRDNFVRHFTVSTQYGKGIVHLHKLHLKFLGD